jgi:hypothetical protein
MPVALCPNCTSPLRYPAELTDPFLHCTVCDEYFPRPGGKHDAQPPQVNPGRAGQAFAAHAPPAKGQAQPLPPEPEQPVPAELVSPPAWTPARAAAPAAKAPEREPWFYPFTVVLAYVLGVVGVLATLIRTGILLAESRRGEATGGAVVFLVVGVLASLVVPALLLIVVDIGRSLRQIRRQR